MMTRGRALLLGLLLWALLMIVPDMARVVRPLGSFGFYANDDGLIYDVVGPFAHEAASPAWKAGLRQGDQLDLTAMRCLPYDREICGSILAAVGGVKYVVPGREITIALVPKVDQAAKRLTITSDVRPTNWFVRLVPILNQITGIAVVLAAAWLVWTRPGPMSWGFFLYVMWFNPGQSFEYYAQLQRAPLLLLAQHVAGAFAQAAGYAGLLLFVTRAPTDKIHPDWQNVERALPLIALIIAIALLASFGSAFGFKTAVLTRATILLGLVVSIAGLTILMLRRRSLTPKDNQRLRWVIWGCLIGLPAFVIADLSQYTTLLNPLWGGAALPEDLAGLLYLLNGFLCLFVFEAIRRSRVVSVSIPLRRATLLALTMSVPALLLHREAEHLQETLDVPQWSWLAIGAIVVFIIGRLHHFAVEVADRYFNREIDRAERSLGEQIRNARDLADVDQLLSTGVLDALNLSSAATFRQTEAGYHRYENGVGWDDTATRQLNLDEPAFIDLAQGKPCRIGHKRAGATGLPLDLETPLLAIPAIDGTSNRAVTLYGPHNFGTDIDAHERKMLLHLGGLAAHAYLRLENEDLRRTITTLQDERALSRLQK